MLKSEQTVEHKHYSPFHRENLTVALERLVQLYLAWGKPDEAARWRKDLEALTNAAGQTVSPNDE
jgi:hypothetical protein